MNRIAVRPGVLRWARERAGLAVTDLEAKFPQLADWEAERERPAGAQAVKKKQLDFN